MKPAITLAAAALSVAPLTLAAQDLPNLEGREIVVATENAYLPLQTSPSVASSWSTWSMRHSPRR